MIAAAARDPDLVKLLLEAGANLRARDGAGRDALWIASRNGSRPIVEVLLAAGAPPDARRADRSPLIAALQSDQPDVARTLLAKGASARIETAEGDTPLMIAAAHGQADLVRPLLAAGIDVNARNSAGDTALIVAVRAGQVAVCRELLAVGADPALRNQSHLGALDTARRRKLTQIVDLLASAR
jgi:ankyrin repeat protein